MFFQLLPWEYGIRNLFRRPWRSALTLVALTTVTLLVLVVLGFIRGLEQTLKVSGKPDVAFVFSLGMGENLEYSSIPHRTADLLASSLSGVRRDHGQPHISPELYLGTQIQLAGDSQHRFGLVRGVVPEALLVHDSIEIKQGRWPRLGEILVGEMAATKLNAQRDALSVGKELQFENRTWKISGIFTAGGATLESEIWCRLDELQQCMRRQDLSLVTVQLNSAGDFAEVDLFCKERLDLELQALRQVDYFAALQRDYGPVRWLSWTIVLLIASAGILVGLNALYGAIVGRISEMAMLQIIGFSRRAAVISTMQEGVMLSMAAALLASLVATGFIHGRAVGFTFGAFQLLVDSQTLLMGNSIALLLGIGGALPPAWRIFRLSVIDSLYTA